MMPPLQDKREVVVHVLKKWEKPGVMFGSTFWIRVRLPDGTVAEGRTSATNWYRIEEDTDIPVVAEKRDDEWTIPGMSRI